MQTLRWGIIFFLLGAVGYFLARQFVQSGPPAREVTVANCDLGQQACAAELPDGGRLTLAIAPQPVPLMKTLSVSAHVDGSNLRPTRLDITGLNMEMGLNRTVLSAAGEAWHGETILPICSQRRMYWQAALLLEGDPESVRVLFRFHTLRP